MAHVVLIMAESLVVVVVVEVRWYFSIWTLPYPLNASEFAVIETLFSRSPITFICAETYDHITQELWGSSRLVRVSEFIVTKARSVDI